MKYLIKNIYLLLVFQITLLNAESNQVTLDFLNQKERQYLKDLQSPLRVGITHIPNQVLKINSSYKGFSIDFFKKLESILNIKFEYVYFETWGKLLDAGENREIDILFSAQKTKPRLSYYNFTDNILKQYNKIIVTNDKTTLLKIENLFEKKVAVVKDSAIFEYLELNYPKINLIPTKSELHSLILTSNKITYATISESVRASYIMKQQHINNLHIAGDINYNYNLRIASRNDFPILSIILSQTVETISPEELQSLHLKWGYIEKEVNYSFIWKIIIGFFIGFLFIFLWVLFLKNLNKILKNKIKSEIEKNKQQQLMLFQQSRLAQMGEALNILAHQWRQPLNILNGLVMQMDIKLSKEDCNNKYLLEKEFNEIENTTKYMSHTIDDFRNFFKPEKQKIKFQLKDNIEHAISLVRPVLSHENILISTRYQNNVELLGYPNEFGQVIVNIINNAKDALLIDTENKKKEIYIHLSTKNQSIILSIEDNAEGISDELLPHIFDPYFSTKSEKNGTGLGLYISKMIIEEHMGGELSAENTSMGAKFSIEFNLSNANNK